MKDLGTAWKTYGFAGLAAAALLTGAVFYVLFFWWGSEYWPLPIDYSYLYVAGRVWGEGASPYNNGYLTMASALTGRDLTPFAYPPNWWGPSQLLALFDPATSNFLWFALSMAFLGVSAWILARVTLRNQAGFTPLAKTLATVDNNTTGVALLACLLAGFIAATKAAGSQAYLGQTSLLIMLGQCLLLLGVVERRQWAVGVGVAVLLLKPQMGIPFAFALLFPRETRMPTIIAGVTTAIISLPALMLGGPVNVLKQFYANVSEYGTRAENVADATSGLGNFLYRATGMQLSALVWLGLAMIGGLAAWLPLKRLMGQEHTTLALLISTTLSIFMFIPLHDWDFVWFTPLLPLLFFMRGPALVLGIVAAVLMTRVAQVLERVIAEDTWIDHQRASATLFAVCVLVAIAAAAVAVLNKRRGALAAASAKS